ncbi:MAG: DUF4140 domain-containing protein, partial [Proteobacteria bacterium]|nr:DUF4140 domain-containing protein [Pseudomonadota bacterium]
MPPLPIQSVSFPIHSVAVHPDGALVERRGTMPIIDGTIRIRNLPLMMDTQSFRVEVDGAQLQFFRLELDVEGLDRADESPLVTAEKKAQRDVDELRSQLESKRAQRANLSELGPRAPTKDEPTLSPQQLKSWIRFDRLLTPWAAQLDDDIRILERKLKTPLEKLTLCQRALNEGS